MIAALHGDANEVDRNFKAAVTASGKDVVVLLDYAAALGNIHHNVRAVEVVDEAVDRAPDDLPALRLAINTHSDAYDVDGVRRTLDLLKKLGQHDEDPMIYANTDAIEAILSAAGATWTQVSERVELVADTLHELGLVSRSCSQLLSDEVILLEFKLDTDVSTAIKAEDAVQQAIANKSFSPADRAIAFSCAP